MLITSAGLWSHTRDIICGKSVLPEETGDLAYRATFSRSELENVGDESVSRLLDQDDIRVWLGPNRHAVFYPLRNREEYNLVLL